MSQPGQGHRIYPHLLEGLEISGPDQVWCGDITYVPTVSGLMYLVAAANVAKFLMENHGDCLNFDSLTGLNQTRNGA